ncbi:MAG: helix-turn-helix domain-containing protein [Clostridia bacterium]
MNEENKISYYSIIPATVRYDKELKPAEKLLYGEVTALANRNGYCYAHNKYFVELYNVTNGTVSKWLSHLQKLGYIQIEIKRNEKQEII